MPRDLQGYFLHGLYCMYIELCITRSPNKLHIQVPALM